MEPVPENYQLKWHSFNTYLHTCVATSLHNESFADVALVTVDGHQIMAHRFILSVSSQYLQHILKFQPKVTTTLPLMIVLPSEINYRTLKILIQYMYSGEATVSKDILESVLRGGDILKVKGLWRPKEDDRFEKKKIRDNGTTRSDSNSNSPSLEKSNKHQAPQPAQKSPQQVQLKQYTSQPKVLNYSINVKKFEEGKSKATVKEEPSSNSTTGNNKKNEDNPDLNCSKSSDSDSSGSSGTMKEMTSVSNKKHKSSHSNSEDESSNSKETLQFLVIKEEPIEWSEVSDADMELIDEKEVFSTEMTIKPEIYMDDNEETEGMYSPLTCELCTETFTVPGEWVRHVQTHTDMLPAKRQRRDKPIKEDENATYPALHCDMCQKYFPTPAEWVRHIQATHTEFELHLSNKKTPNDGAIKEVRQQSQKNMIDFHKMCTICKKMFPSHASMVIHRRTHTGEKPYECEFCFKGFNVKSNLLRHLRTLHDKIINSTDVETGDENVD